MLVFNCAWLGCLWAYGWEIWEFDILAKKTGRIKVTTFKSKSACSQFDHSPVLLAANCQVKVIGKGINFECELRVGARSFITSP